MKVRPSIISLFLFVLMGCVNGSVSSEQMKDGRKDSSDAKPETTNGTTQIAGNNDAKQLLTGKWQSVDDSTNYLVFENNLRIETAAGMEGWSEETYVLSDACRNAMDSASQRPLEKDRYISCPKSDMCWYIVNLDENNLSLSYIGRGNTLTYRRVK